MDRMERAVQSQVRQELAAHERRLERLLDRIEQKVSALHMNEQDVLSKIAEANASLDNIEADVKKLQAEVAAQGGNVPQSIVDAVNALADRAKTVAAEESDGPTTAAETEPGV